MKKMIKSVLVVVVAMTMSLSAVETENVNVKTDVSMLKMFKVAMSSRVMIQQVAKAYLYVGNDIATTKAEKELTKSLKQFDAKLKKLNDSINDPKTKNLLLFIESNREDIGDLLKEPYSLENAQEIIDLAEAISEGSFSIAKTFEKKKGGTKLGFKGQRYHVIQIAKYYIAYKSGIKDKNTVKHMKQSVNAFQKGLELMKAYPENTPDMNRLVNKIEKGWKIVHQFYLDIEDGDLPLIVYDTSKKIEKKMQKYIGALIKNKSKKK